MLGSSSPATATLHTTTSSATPTSPTRPSRLRGLSYLRNYTHNHLHGSSSQRAEQQAQQQQAQAQAQQAQQQAQQEPKREQRPGLGRRSISSPGESSNTPAEPRRSGSQSGIQSGENGWVPTVQGRSGLSRQAIDLTSTDTHPVQRETSQSPNAMTRSRAATAVAPLSNAEPSSSAPAAAAKEAQPTIRFIPHVEVRSTRPSLHFSAVSRTLKNASTVVRVGRYSERDSDKAEENSLPVGFKSKVVSRRHCEFWCTSGQWYVKDVKSSSGTFLNHVRLSSPGVESRPYPVNDGDVVQLGIDFKGGEEVIFRCVKIRVECNRGWQKSLNNFNTSTHKRLLKSAGVGGKSKNRDSDAASVNSSECSICLNPVAPCQALFVAPCSHVWHYKCVRNLIHGPNWPNFLCPNCRFVADLEADVEPLEEEEEVEQEAEEVEFEATHAAVELDESAELDQSGETGGSSDDALESNHAEEPTTPANPETQQEQDQDQDQDQQRQNHEPQPNPTPNSSHDNPHTSAIPTDELAHLSLHQPPAPATSSTTTSTTADPTPSSNPITITPSKSRAPPPPDPLSARSATPRSTTPFALAASLVSEAEAEAEGEGPGTPRNGAGPFLLDGQGTGEGRGGA